MLSPYIVTVLPLLNVPNILYDVDAPLLTFNEVAVIVPVFELCVVPVDVEPFEVDPDVELSELDEIYFPLTHP